MFEESVSTSSIWASMNSWCTPTVFFVLLNVMIGTIAIASSLTNQKQQREEHDEQQRPQIARSPSVLQRLRSINLYGHRSQEPHSIATRFGLAQNSDTHYPLDQTHLLHTLETQTQYVFEQTHKTQELETETLYVSQEKSQDIPLEKPQETEKFVQNFDFGGPKTPAKEIDGFVDQPMEGNDENEGLRSLDEVFSQLADRNNNCGGHDTEMVSEKKTVRLQTNITKSASSKAVSSGHLEEENIVEARRPATMRERRAKATEEDDEVDAKADDFIYRFKQQLKLQRLESIIRKK